jgi:hypothetical protein
MPGVSRRMLLVPALALCAGLFAACGGGDGPSGSPTPTVTVTSAPVPTATGELREVEIEVEDGRVRGPDTFRVRQGETILIRVRADVTEEVHVHGYDVKADVAPGEPAEITLEATFPGTFEVELEEAGLLLFRLQVVP